MRRSSVLLSVLVITLLVISLVISCAPKPKETVLLRLATAFPGGCEMSLHLEEYANRFNERADGEYQIKHYPAETLVKTLEALDAVRTGAVEMTFAAPALFAGLDPRLGVLPFMCSNSQANAAACQPLMERYDKIYQEKFNQKVVSCFQIGAMDLCSKNPVRTLEDWDGLLVGALDPDTANLTTAFGGAPVTIPWTEMYSSLEKGVIDAQFVGSEYMLIGKLTDILSHATFFYAIPSFQVVSINLDVWNAMPEHIQDILLEESQWQIKNRNEFYSKKLNDDIEALRALGMDCYILPKAERDRWIAAAQPIIDEKISAMGEFGVELKQITDEINRQYP
jgi:TRAP-type C4-dicarboxylate transport system substrate-binding protein